MEQPHTRRSLKDFQGQPGVEQREHLFSHVQEGRLFEPHPIDGEEGKAVQQVQQGLFGMLHQHPDRRPISIKKGNAGRQLDSQGLSRPGGLYRRLRASQAEAAQRGPGRLQSQRGVRRPEIRGQ